MKKEVFVIRHAESLYNNISRKLKGFTPPGLHDAGLSSNGISQITSIMNEIKHMNFDCVVCSPLQRSIQTALLLNLNVKIIMSELCRERMINDGDVGSNVQTLKLFYPMIDYSYLNNHTWDAETPEQIQQRCNQFVKFVSSLNYKKILVVSHYGFLEVLTGKKMTNCELSPLFRTFVYNDVDVNISSNTQFYDKWGDRHDEPETLKIFKKFITKDKPYFDIGACFGQTVIFGAQLAKHVYAVEPDPKAWIDLNHNVKINNLDNVTLINKALSNKTEVLKFGCKGKWGNSKSSAVLTDKMTEIIEVNSTTIDDLLTQYPDFKNCNFLKMDIEGGEKFVIPSIKNYLKSYTPTFYVSLHTKYGMISLEDTEEILDVLFGIYKYAYHRDLDHTLTKSEILDNMIEQIIFSNSKLC